MKYQVQLIQTREAFVDVEADSVAEAYEKASERVTEDHWQLQGCENGEIAEYGTEDNKGEETHDESRAS